MPQGAANASKLVAIVEDLEGSLPADAIPTLKVLVAALSHLKAEIGKLDAEISCRAKENDVARRLMTIPGIGPLIATALATLAPPPETFHRGVTSPPGSASCRDSIRPAASSALVLRPGWE